MCPRQWDQADTARPLLRQVRRTASCRKLLLLGCGCCRAAWGWIADDRSRRAVDVIERFADGEATAAELEMAGRDASVARDWAFGTLDSIPPHLQTTAARCTAWAVHVLSGVERGDRLRRDYLAEDVTAATDWLRDVEPGRPDEWQRVQVALIRDVFIGPKPPPPLPDGWLSSAATGLARSIYADRAFDRLPILADALEDAGCRDARVLAHCRSPGPHIRGCWVVDLVLGKS